jgi:SAM-dependent methyltransferase
MGKKTSMADQPIGIWNRFVSSRNILRAYRKGQFGNAEKDAKHHETLCGTLKEYAGVPLKEARILDIGCGQMAQQVAMFSADGARITGIDIEIPTYRMNPKVFFESLKQNGFERAVKSLVRHALFDGGFIKDLSRVYGMPIPFTNLDCKIMSALALQFPDEHFDFVFSDCVFEHIENVPKAIQELNRVLKKTGIARITIHLFSSLSGGHNLDWSNPDTAPSKTVPPWDHLLENNYPANAFLNKLRLGQFRHMFRDGMSLVKEQTAQQGAGLLTEEFFSFLSAKGYTREDLLTHAVTFICRKK